MLVRIDDFPTGVKPREKDDLKLYKIILDEFEKRKIPYVLGVVPYLCSPMDLEFLLQFQYCEVALHGFSHNFLTWNGTNTPEFDSVHHKIIEDKLMKGIQHLEIWGHKRPRIYIPPFNQIVPQTLSGLVHQQFQAITSGINGYPNLPIWNPLLIYTPKKEFYGRSYQMLKYMNQFTPEDHLALHLTWEAECLVHGNYALPKVLDKLLEKCPSPLTI